MAGKHLLVFSVFLLSIGSSYIICGYGNAHLDVECTDKSRFNNIFQYCNLDQGVISPAHILGSILDVLIPPVTMLLFII